MKRLLIDIIIIILGLVLVRMCEGKSVEYIESTDTIVVHDTTTVVAPQATESRALGVSKARLRKAPQKPYLDDMGYIKQTAENLTCADTADYADVLVPDSQKIFRDSLYTLWASGYNIRVDSIKVYPTNNYIYKTITKIEYSKRKKWSLGVGVGYGYNGRAFSPYVGIGVYYNIYPF